MQMNNMINLKIFLNDFNNQKIYLQTLNNLIMNSICFGNKQSMSELANMSNQIYLINI